MKLQKAIEIAEIEETSDFVGITYDFEDAFRLLIEAGKRVKEARVKGTIWDYSLLPGETEE